MWFVHTSTKLHIHRCNASDERIKTRQDDIKLHVDICKAYNRETEWSMTKYEKVKITTTKGKVLPYSFPSVGLRADPGVQAVSPQVTF